MIFTFKRYLSLLFCLFITITLLVLSTSPVLAQDHSLTLAKPFIDDIYYLQYEWVTPYFNNVFCLLQLGEKSEEENLFLWGKYGYRYYFTEESPQGLYVGAYYSLFYYYQIHGYAPNQITPGMISLALGGKWIFKNGFSIDAGVQVGDRYEASTYDSGSVGVPGFLVALGYSW